MKIKMYTIMFFLLAGLAFGQRKLTTNEATVIVVDNMVAVGDGVTPLTAAITETDVDVELIREYDDGSVPTLVKFDCTAAGVNDLVAITSASTSVTGAFSLELTAAQVNFTGYLTVTVIDTDVMLPWSRRFIVTSAAMVDADYGGTYQHVLLADTDHVINHLTIDDDTGNALVITTGGGNGHGVVITGNGTGEGISVTGGATGIGMEVIGGATSGSGMKVWANGTNDIGLEVTGLGTEAGMKVTGGATGGTGLHVLGGATNAIGAQIIGTGTASALQVSASGTSGNGIDVAGGTTGHGMEILGGGGATGPFHALRLGAGTNGYGLTGTFDLTLLASIGSGVWTATADNTNTAQGTMGRYAGRKGR